MSYITELTFQVVRLFLKRYGISSLIPLVLQCIKEYNAGDLPPPGDDSLTIDQFSDKDMN